MAGNVLKALSKAGTSGARGRPPGCLQTPQAGCERRLDLHVFVDAHGRTVVGRAWERSVWRQERVLIAECPAPSLTPAMESALRQVAAGIARDRAWRRPGSIVFSLDDCSGLFQVIAATQRFWSGGVLPVGALPEWESRNGHALIVRMDAGGDSGRPDLSWLFCGATRGDALRRAYDALSALTQHPSADRTWLIHCLESYAFCAGLTGARLELPVSLSVFA